MAWPFRHNWSSTYRVTYSFLTDILASRSGFEQRIAERVEPRRSIETTLLADEDTARAVDRFVWATGPATFDHVDPVAAAVSTVRLADTQTLEHPNGRVVVSAVTLAVEPGTDTYDEPTPDVALSYEGRYVFPFRVDWREGAPDTLALTRTTLNYGRGRIAVTRPIAFASRTSTFNLLRASVDEAIALVDFHRYMRGRQGDFWCPSVLDDLVVTGGESVSFALTTEDGIPLTTEDGLTIDVQEAGVPSAYLYVRGQGALVDEVNVAVRLEMRSGTVYYRRIVESTDIGNNQVLLTLSALVPEIVDQQTVRRCSWMRVGRFASDDLTIEWVTDAVARSQVQVVTLPYSEPETTFSDDPLTLYLLDEVGADNFLRYADLKDYIVNTQIPRLDP